jgi:hypothetical protein
MAGTMDAAMVATKATRTVAPMAAQMAETMVDVKVVWTAAYWDDIEVVY